MPSGGKGRHEYRVVAAEVEERHGFVVALLELEKKIDAEREDVHEVDVHFRDVTRHFLDHFLLDGKRFVSHDDGGFHHIDVIQLPEMLVDAFDERTVPFGRVRQIEFLGETVALAKPAWTLEYIFVVHADRDRPYIELDVLPRFDAKIHCVLLFFRSIFPHVGCHALRLRAPSDAPFPSPFHLLLRTSAPRQIGAFPPTCSKFILQRRFSVINRPFIHYSI